MTEIRDFEIPDLFELHTKKTPMRKLIGVFSVGAMGLEPMTSRV